MAPFCSKSDSSLGPAPWVVEPSQGPIDESEQGPLGPGHCAKPIPAAGEEPKFPVKSR